MASGKYEKKSPTKTIKTYSKSNVKPEGKFEQKTNSPKYKMAPQVKRRILALIAAGFIAGSIIRPAPPETEAHAAMDIPSAQSASVQEYKPDTPFYTLGVANYNAQLSVNDQNYPIGNSFVIVSEDEVITSDVHENFLKGQLSNSDFKEFARLTEEEMENYSFYQVSAEEGANVISGNSIVATIPNGDYVLALKSSENENSENYFQTLSIIDGNLYTGLVSSDSIREVGTFEAITYKATENIDNIQNMVMVDTSKDKYISLNLRSEPGQDIIVQIPYGSFVHVSGETKQYGNKSWTSVKYKSPDGNEFEGWVATDYLSTDVVQEQPRAKVIEGIHVNASQGVTGIDISTMPFFDLVELLDNGISSETNSVHGTFDTSLLQGEIGLVGIKLGASAYSPGDLEILDYSNYMYQVSLCEQKKMPYVLYYYSTSVTEKEALEELEVIEERMNNLKETYGLKYCVSVAIDKELAENTKPDRQRNGNIAEQTEALATLINGIQEKDLTDNVLIYAPGRVMKPDLDQIFSLEALYPMLDNPQAVALWQCSLMYKNGNIAQNLTTDIAYAESKGFQTAMSQVVLDAKVNSGNKFDINNINFEYYRSLTKHLEINQENTYTLQFCNIVDESTTYSLESNSQYDNELEI